MADNPNLGGWGRSAWNTGSWNTPFTAEVTGVEAATAVGTVNIWEKVDPGQIAGWNPVTYTQAPDWTKIAA